MVDLFRGMFRDTFDQDFFFSVMFEESHWSIGFFVSSVHISNPWSSVLFGKIGTYPIAHRGSFILLGSCLEGAS